jgi:hypothetical protein
VLVGVDDVAAGVGEEAADRGDQPGLVRAGEEQARGGGLASDAGIIAVDAMIRRSAVALLPAMRAKLRPRAQDRVQRANLEFAVCA